MRQKRCVPHEEWLLLLGRFRDELRDRLHAVAADLQTVITVPAAWLRKPSSHPVREPAVREVAFPPLAALMTEIAPLAEDSRHRLKTVQVRDQLSPPLLVQLRVRLCVFRRRIVASYAMCACVVPGDQRRQRRPTQRCRHVAARKHDTLRRQLVQMRRLDIRMPHEPVIGPCLVVRDNHHNVRRPLRPQQRRRNNQSQ